MQLSSYFFVIYTQLISLSLSVYAHSRIRSHHAKNLAFITSRSIAHSFTRVKNGNYTREVEKTETKRPTKLIKDTNTTLSERLLASSSYIIPLSDALQVTATPLLISNIYLFRPLLSL